MGAALGAHGSLGVPARDRGSGPVGEARGGRTPGASFGGGFALGWDWRESEGSGSAGGAELF